jgi:hypothetical protein
VDDGGRPERHYAGPSVRIGFAAAIVFFSATANAAEPFHSVIRGPFLSGSFGTSSVGDALLAQVGANISGIRSQDERRWLLMWDVFGSGMFGLIGNQHPFLTVLGVRGSATAELGRRIWNDRAWSPYVGGRIGGDMRILEHPGLAAGALETINDSSAGVIAHGLARIDAGMSMLDDRRSLLLVLFVQEALQARTVTQPMFAFTQLGLGARFDLARSVMVEIDGAWGVTPNRTDSARGTSDQTTRASLSGNFRKIFANGIWLGLTASIARDTDTITYAASKTTYGTGNAPTVEAALWLGWSFGGPK